MKKSGTLLLFLSLALFPLLASDSEVIAEIDGVPLRIVDLAPEVRELLATNSTSADVRDISIKAAVMTEVKLRSTLELLKQRQITADSSTAKKYIDQRSREYPESGKLLCQGLSKQLHDKKFQLKCAIYFFVSSLNPELASVSSTEISSFYHANSRLFRRTEAPEYLAVKAGVETPDAEKKIRDVRLSLLQGQNIISAALSEKLKAEKPDAGVLFALQKFKLKKNAVSPVFQCGGTWCVAVCLKEAESGFAPLQNVEAFIAEELISRRCGAAFDKILKQEISRKNIKYRR